MGTQFEYKQYNETYLLIFFFVCRSACSMTAAQESAQTWEAITVGRRRAEDNSQLVYLEYRLKSSQAETETAKLMAAKVALRWCQVSQSEWVPPSEEQ